jgi:hypothetical protein
MFVCIQKCGELDDSREDLKHCRFETKELLDGFLGRNTEGCPCGNNSMFVELKEYPSAGEMEVLRTLHNKQKLDQLAEVPT